MAADNDETQQLVPPEEYLHTKDMKTLLSHEGPGGHVGNPSDEIGKSKETLCYEVGCFEIVTYIYICQYIIW
jgi:hypothetical protein